MTWYNTRETFCALNALHEVTVLKHSDIQLLSQLLTLTTTILQHCWELKAEVLGVPARDIPWQASQGPLVLCIDYMDIRLEAGCGQKDLSMVYKVYRVCV
jgi:hypothetical protein